MVRGEIRVNAYNVVERAVEDGVTIGWQRAHKHSENPSPSHVRDTIAACVMSELSTWLYFDTESTVDA